MTLDTRYSFYVLISALTASSSIILTEIALRFYVIPPPLIALYTNAAGGLFLLLPILRQGTGFWRRWPRSDWVRFIVAAFALYVAGMVLAFIAIGMIGAGKSALISRLEALFVVGLAVLILGERWSARRWVASFIALAGTLLVNFDPQSWQLTLGLGEVLTLTAALVFAGGIVIIKPLLDRYDGQLLTGSAMLVACVFLVPFCFFLDVLPGQVEAGETASETLGWLALGILILMSLLRGISWSTYIIAMRYIGASRCAILFLTTAFFTVGLQVGVDAIAPGLGLQVPPNLLPAIAGGALIILGIFILQRS